MTHRVFVLALAAMALVCNSAGAQGLKPLQPSQPRATSAAAQTAPQGAADYIVAIVNSEPITNSEIRVEVQRTAQQLAQQGRTAPDARELSRAILDRMINDKAQLQVARETGIRIEDSAIDQAEQNVARQNKIDVRELRRRLALDGFSLPQFRDQLREQLILTRLKEREVDGRVRVSDIEVEQYLRDQPLANDPASQNINIAQILIAVPDAASLSQIAVFQAKAQSALERARAGEDFGVLARELSDSPDRANGGQLGLRSADRYPPLFLDATQALSVGQVSAVLRSGAGFHVLKLVERSAAAMTITQSRARHILIRETPQINEAAVRNRLTELKRRIQAGQADFAAMARENSEDGSAAQGGELGWASPGQFVPEFEEVMNALAPGQISDPLVSRFGLHLIQLMERRNSPLSEKEQKEVIRNMLREKKLQDAYVSWTQDVRGRAYVEMREPPQ